MAAALFASDSEAYPFFSRKVGRDCTYCHALFPRLNETGRVYRSNGYRFAVDEWKEVKDWASVPLSAEVEVEGAYNRVKAAGVRTESSDLKIEEVEITAAGAFGKDGKITSLVSVVSGQTDTGTDTSIHKAFIQVNDLVGPAGEGFLNLRAGQFDMGLPFLNTVGTVLTNRYLADSVLGVLAGEERAVELNGSVVTDEESMLPTHRYSAGVVRENVYDDNKLRGYYAAYSATFREKYNIGVIYRGGHEKYGSKDASFGKYGLAGSADAGPFIVTMGYFNANRSGTPRRSDWLAELIYQPLPRLSFAARYDYLKEKGRTGAKSQTFMARYNILSNVYTQLEYRGLTDNGHATGANEGEDKLRLLFVAVF
ncbi:MAG: hypothetical protein HY889_08700 [Deltaproteobacteria bacterium]|nr:hypothetical protein [Deltaproteobacteria bacterium]